MSLAAALLAAALVLPARAAGPDPLAEAFSRAWSLATPSDDRPVLAPEDLAAGPYHLRHAEIFGKHAVGFNLRVLEAVDAVQKTAMDGGGYFTGARADPPESPIGYALKLFGRPLLAPPRKTSFCTGASYAALIEALNLLFGEGYPALSETRAEALRMQEPDGGRREDGVKFWGRWNADDAGIHYALVQYSGMGRVVSPRQARAGDFINILWKNGGSHSAVFLGWHVSKTKGKSLLYWSSQEPTNGLADYSAPVANIEGVKIVRLVNPAALASFDVDAPLDARVAWDPVGWTSGTALVQQSRGLGTVGAPRRRL